VSNDKQMIRVGTERPNALLFTGGVGALVDLPSMSVIVRGLDAWDHDKSQLTDLTEPRLLRNVRAVLGRQVAALKPAPYLERAPGEKPTGDHARVGVPVTPFPRWMRCSRCSMLTTVQTGGTSGAFLFRNNNPYKPDEARFVHENCPQARQAKIKPSALPARFVLACKDGHLDEFPYVEYVHRGKPCSKGVDGKLEFHDPGRNAGSAISLYCTCGAKRTMRDGLKHHSARTRRSCRCAVAATLTSAPSRTAAVARPSERWSSARATSGSASWPGPSILSAIARGIRPR